MNRFIIGAVLACILSACVPFVVGGVATGVYMMVTDKQSLHAGTRDEDITAAVKTAFIKDNLVKARDINVTTYHGIVTLEGSVSTQREHSQAVSIASKQKNVRTVNSHLTVWKRN